jgi:hypothetical protein
MEFFIAGIVVVNLIQLHKVAKEAWITYNKEIEQMA